MFRSSVSPWMPAAEASELTAGAGSSTDGICNRVDEEALGEGRLSGVQGCEDLGTVHADGLRARVLGGPGRTEVLEEDSEAEEDEDEGKSEAVGPGIPVRAARRRVGNGAGHRSIGASGGEE